MRKFTTKSTKQVSGKWSIEDALWNYLDVPHLNHVHTQIGGDQLYLSEDVSISLVEQRVGPLRLRAPLAVWREGVRSVKYVTALTGFVIEVCTDLSQQVGSACAKTTYSVSSGIGLRPFHRLVHYMLGRNFDLLMSEDLPMRERRAELRAFGAKFKGDRDGYGFRESTRIAKNRVVPAGEGSITITLSESSRDRSAWTRAEIASGLDIYHFGPDKNDVLHVFLGFCPHEGARLAVPDICTVGPSTIICPWHGRRISSKELGPADEAEIGGLHFKRNGSDLTVSWRQMAITKESLE